MKSVKYVLILLLMVLSITDNSLAQGVPNWQLVGTETVDSYLFPYDSISNNGRYIASFRGDVEIVDTANDYTTLMSSFMYYRLLLSTWMDNTVVYWPFRRGAEPWPCADSAALTLGRFDATTQNYEAFCFDTVPPSFDVEHMALSIDTLQRMPVNADILLIKRQYLVNLAELSIVDLTPDLPTQLDLTQLDQWIGHGHVLWDPQNWQPTAYIAVNTVGESLSSLVQQSFELCPIGEGSCHTLVDVLSHVHGAVAEYTLSNDGQTLLWSVYEYPENTQIPRFAASPRVSDVRAFATDIASGATVQIFRLSEYHSPSRGIGMAWSPDGQTLAVYIQNGLPGSGIRSSLMWVRFSAPETASQVSGVAWNDAEHEYDGPNSTRCETPDCMRFFTYSAATDSAYYSIITDTVR